VDNHIVSMSLNTAIELHDSVLGSVSILGGNIEVALFACIHSSEGEPGMDDGWCFVQDAIVEFQEATFTGDLGNAPSKNHNHWQTSHRQAHG
jgi:hypothetical protein